MKKSLLVSCAIITLVSMFGCFRQPALKLEHDGAAIIVHIETLGEYPTTVRHIRVDDARSGKVVLDLLTERGTPQIHSFRLSVGDNSVEIADPDHGSYRVIVPRGKNTFYLQTGVVYRLTVWGDGSGFSETKFKF